MKLMFSIEYNELFCIKTYLPDLQLASREALYVPGQVLPIGANVPYKHSDLLHHLRPKIIKSKLQVNFTLRNLDIK